MRYICLTQFPKLTQFPVLALGIKNRSPCLPSQSFDADPRVECPRNMNRLQKPVGLWIVTVNNNNNNN